MWNSLPDDNILPSNEGLQTRTTQGQQFRYYYHKSYLSCRQSPDQPKANIVPRIVGLIRNRGMLEGNQPEIQVPKHLYL